jgi:hypothetical protein
MHELMPREWGCRYFCASKPEQSNVPSAFRFAEEQLFGQARAPQLMCMVSAGTGCEGHFPSSQLWRALPEKVFSKWVTTRPSKPGKIARLAIGFFSAEWLRSALHYL